MKNLSARKRSNQELYTTVNDDDGRVVTQLQRKKKKLKNVVVHFVTILSITDPPLQHMQPFDQLSRLRKRFPSKSQV